MTLYMYKKSLSRSGKKLSRYLVFSKSDFRNNFFTFLKKTKYRDNFFPGPDSDFLYMNRVIFIFDGAFFCIHGRQRYLDQEKSYRDFAILKKRFFAITFSLFELAMSACLHESCAVPMSACTKNFRSMPQIAKKLSRNYVFCKNLLG